MVDGLGVHGADDAEVICNGGGVGQKIAEPRAGLAVLLEWKNGTSQRDRGLLRGHAGKALPAAHRFGKLFAVEFVEERFVIEQIHLRGRAALEKVDDALGLRGEVWKIGKPAGGNLFRGSRRIARQQTGEGQSAKPARDPGKKMTARDAEGITGGGWR